MRAILDDGLDELAASAHAGFKARLPVTVAAAVAFAGILPWRVCAIWTCLAVGAEISAWFGTRRQFLGLEVGTPIRLWHLSGLLVSSLLWVGLGGLAWASGRPDGALCAVVVWLAVIFFAQTNAYQSSIGFVLGGVVPAAAATLIVLFAPRAANLPLPSFLAILTLAFLFAGDGVGRMLTARRKLKDAQAKLVKSEALYRVLAENVTDVITLADADGARLYMSPSIEPALGYPLAEIARMPPYEFVYPEDREPLARKLADLDGGGQVSAEYRITRADGEVRWIETNFSLVPQPDGPPHLVGVGRDIHVRKTLEAELIEARVVAEAAAAAKSDFLANMTHELRTPLNAIIGFAGLLKASPRLDRQDGRHARLIADASATLLDLVNSVLDFSRLEAGAVELDLAPFDPGAVAAAVVELMSVQAAAKGFTLALETTGKGFVSGDAKRLRQVLLNLVSNAIKFTARGGVTLRLTQTPTSDRTVRLRAEVVDTGVGIPAAQIGQVFDRFTQADVSVSRRFGGTGLGLAICKRIVDLMGGEIGVASIEGEGSSFWIELNLPEAVAPAAPSPEETGVALDRPVRLLLVEDVAINRELVKTVLAGFDVEIETAEDGVAAIEAFKAGAFDLVLMDVQMPVMDGLTATRRIRALPQATARTTPIVAMTANVLPEQVARCAEAGMDGHLGKPMNPAELLNTIVYWTSNERQEPTAAASA